MTGDGSADRREETSVRPTSPLTRAQVGRLGDRDLSPGTPEESQTAHTGLPCPLWWWRSRRFG